MASSRRAIFGSEASARRYEPSRRERTVSDSEAWSVAILPGSGDRSQSDATMRHAHVRWFIGIAGIVMAVLVGQLFQLQVVHGARNQALADGNRIRQTVIRAPRGAIYDRKQNLLARNVANFDLTVIPAQLPRKDADREVIFQSVSDLSGVPLQEIKDKIEKAGKAVPVPVLIQPNVSREVALKVEEKLPELDGVDLDTNAVREYLDTGLLSQFLGYTGRISDEDSKKNPDYQPTDYIGKVALERGYEADLRGTNGAEQVEVDATGKPIKVLASKDPVAGSSVQLSIDFGLQKAMADELKKQVDASGSGRGAAVAVNPRNGQILAAVNMPTYDGNLFTHGIKSADYDKLLNDPNKPLFNKVTAGGYPIGSTSKPFVAQAALQEGTINESTTIEDKGFIDVPNVYDPSIVYKFTGWETTGLGIVNVVRAIAKSSDIFFYEVGGGFEGFKGLGATKLLDYYSKFGFGQRPGLDTGNDSAGSIPSVEGKKKSTGEAWTVGDTYNISIGQGNIMASPLQLAMAFSAIANGGTLYKPHMVDKVVDEDGKVVRTINPEVVRSDFLDAKSLAIVKQGLRQTMVDGTGCCSTNREVPVPVSGKTGTAETSSRGFDGKNPITKPHAWFEAFAPSDNPEIVVVALVENAGEGAQFALPVARETLKYYFAHK